MNRPSRRQLALALALVGLFAFGLRFIDLAHAPFINDEPQFIDAARTQLTTGRILTRSIVRGTSGYYYGGSVFWFYGLLHWIGFSSARACVAAMCLAVTASQVYFGLALSRRLLATERLRDVFDHELGYTLGVVWLLTASSPHQYFWSRLAWDQLTDAVAFLVAGLLCASPTTARAFGGGGLLGFGISSHPMIAPFSVIAGVSLAVGERPRRWGSVARRAVVLGLSALVPLGAWLVELWRQRGQPSSFGKSVPLTLDRWIEPLRSVGVHHIAYFFDQEWDSFMSSRFAPPAWVTLERASLYLWAALALVGLLLGLRTHRRLALTGLVALVAYPLFYAWRGIPVEPHYQFPTGWIALLGAAFCLASSIRWLRTAALVAVLCISVWQLDFIRRWHAWIDARGGTRGVHYGVPLVQQEAIVESVCKHAGPVTARLEITAFAVSFAYVASTHPPCGRERVRWCGMDRACEPPREGETLARVFYANGVDARLSTAFSR